MRNFLPVTRGGQYGNSEDPLRRRNNSRTSDKQRGKKTKNNNDPDASLPAVDGFPKRVMRSPEKSAMLLVQVPSQPEDGFLISWPTNASDAPKLLSTCMYAGTLLWTSAA